VPDPAIPPSSVGPIVSTSAEVAPAVGAGQVVSTSAEAAPSADAAPIVSTSVEAAPAAGGAPAVHVTAVTGEAAAEPATSSALAPTAQPALAGPKTATAAPNPAVTPGAASAAAPATTPPLAGNGRGNAPYGAMGGYGAAMSAYGRNGAPAAAPGYGGMGGHGGPGGYGRVAGGYPGASGTAPAPRPAAVAPGASPRGFPGMMGGMATPVAPPAMPTAQAPAGRIEDATARDADRRTTEALRRTLPVNFEGVPLEEALRFVSDAAKVDVIADWKEIEAAGLPRDAAVSLTLRQGAPAEQVLTWVLRSAGGANVGFAIDHGVVVVAPLDRIDQMVITRAYDVGSLAADGQALEQLVRDTIAPQSWRENGGIASARVFNGKLFVTATEPNHRQVERLLGLMQAQGMPGAGDPGMPGMPGAMPKR